MRDVGDSLLLAADQATGTVPKVNCPHPSSAYGPSVALRGSLRCAAVASQGEGRGSAPSTPSPRPPSRGPATARPRGEKTPFLRTVRRCLPARRREPLDAGLGAGMTAERAPSGPRIDGCATSTSPQSPTAFRAAYLMQSSPDAGCRGQFTLGSGPGHGHRSKSKLSPPLIRFTGLPSPFEAPCAALRSHLRVREGAVPAPPVTPTGAAHSPNPPARRKLNGK
ncbi:hypothetical protein DFR52_106211 [Hoeflea marina]|uniref:Uncharacterized protein n=1 Tax=Hoeflea marina TaxID=274592 RepID=A0A317PJB7_9HYPH|nr:hypothetical protein DFR52_106211 [Hoeflea marina]